MKRGLFKNTLVTLMVGLVLTLNLQYYFFSNSIFNSFSPQKHYSKTSDGSKTQMDDAGLIDEDETNETELSQSYFVVSFINNSITSVSNIQVLACSCFKTISSKVNILPLHLFIMLWRI